MRFLVLLAILGSGPLVMLLAWPLISKQVMLADLRLAVRTQPRSEVIVTGFLKNDQAEPFSLESLQVEEPGKEPYRRLISLDADRRFELALGQPIAGTYRVAAWTRKADWLKGKQERWLRVPELVVNNDSASKPQHVGAQDYDYQQLFLVASFILAAQTVCLLVWYRLRPRAGATSSASL